jgi:hypothetical protein
LASQILEPLSCVTGEIQYWYRAVRLEVLTKLSIDPYLPFKGAISGKVSQPASHLLFIADDRDEDAVNRHFCEAFP